MGAQSRQKLIVKAPAKVNLCLNVKHPPRNGYHELDSVFQVLDFGDALSFETSPCVQGVLGDAARTGLGTPISISCPGIELPVADNLVFKAIDAAEQACSQAFAPSGQCVHVFVDKQIPAGGGLGGGSSDAAAALKAYARACGLDALDPRILSAAQRVGADVALFLYGGATLMVGRGDVLRRRLPAFPLPLVLMGEALGNSTPQVYRGFDEQPCAQVDAFALADALEQGGCSAKSLAALCANNLAPAACRLAPSIAERVERAKADPDVLNALVTGSGATSYAVCADDAAAQAFARRAAAYSSWVKVAHAAPCQEALPEL